MTIPTNSFADFSRNLAGEHFTTLLEFANVHIERIVSQGHASHEGFWYDQEDETVELKPGDLVNIPAHQKHRVDWTTPVEPTIWLAMHYGDRC